MSLQNKLVQKIQGNSKGSSPGQFVSDHVQETGSVLSVMPHNDIRVCASQLERAAVPCWSDFYETTGNGNVYGYWFSDEFSATPTGGPGDSLGVLV